MPGAYERLSNHDIRLLTEAIEEYSKKQTHSDRFNQLVAQLRGAEEVLVLSRTRLSANAPISSAGDVSVEDGAQKLVSYLRSRGHEEAGELFPTWNHMGAIIVDAVLQANRTYDTMVLPRVQKVIDEYPSADTVSGFLDLASRTNLMEVLNYNEQARIDRMVEIANTFRKFEIETVSDLQARLQGPEDEREALRMALDAIYYVGPKTVDYFDLLVGNPSGLAVDLRVRRVLRWAGIEEFNYEHCADVLRTAAEQLSWSTRELDALLWRIGERDEEM